MKKKIKDLTLIEANKYCRSRKCENCPVRDKYGACLLDYIATYPIEGVKVFREVLEREIEINESDNEKY